MKDENNTGFSNNKEKPAPSLEPRQLSDYQKGYLFVTLVVAISAFIFSLLIQAKLDSTALLYVGLPTALAFLVAFIEKPKSLVIASLKGLTIFLLLSVIIFREGFICIIMAAPILYPITALAALIIQWIIKRNRDKNDRNSYLQASPMLLILLLMSLEGTHPLLTVERTNQVIQQRVISASIDDIKKALAVSTSFNSPQSMITSLFPKPVSSTGNGIDIGDTRKVDYIYYKHIFFNPHKGSTIFKVSDLTDQSIAFNITQDTSYISHYLKWNFSKVSWQKIDEKTTRLSWTLSYDRKLDPAWYFAPLQQFFVAQTADYLIDNLVATIETQNNITPSFGEYRKH